jgi:hypothetical protein
VHKQVIHVSLVFDVEFKFVQKTMRYGRKNNGDTG